MRTIRILSVLMLAGFVFFAAVPVYAQNGRIAKKAAKEATKDAAGDAAKDATKNAAAGAAKKPQPLMRSISTPLQPSR